MDSKFLLKQLKVLEEAERIMLENRALKEENDVLKKYAALLLSEYGYNTKEGLNRVIDAISNKEKILSNWNKEVEFEKECGEI